MNCRSQVSVGVLSVLVLLSIPVSAHGFSLLGGDAATLLETFEQADRWSSVSGLSDGIQVGVEAGFATELGAVGGEVALLNQAVEDAFIAWENDVLQFDIVLDAAGVSEGASNGFELDLFAVRATHPLFSGNSFFGVTLFDTVFDPNRPLTNGQSFAGRAITGADIYINVDNVQSLSLGLGMSQAQQLDSLQRLLMHEIGHAIGLGHSNSNNPFGTGTFYDTDFDPFNTMAIDPTDPFNDLLVSGIADNSAIMSNRPCGEPANFIGCGALFYTSLQNDDIGGRDALYPVPEPSAALMIAGGLAVLSLVRRARTPA